MTQTETTSTSRLSRDRVEANRLHLVACALSVILLALIAPLLILAIITPLTVSGVLYLAGAVAVVVGFWGIAWRRTHLGGLLWLGLGLIVVVALVRVILLGGGTARIKMLTLPGESPGCWLNCLLDEQDVALFSTRVLSLAGGISPTEQAGLLDAMASGYQSMAKTQPFVPSPFVRTYLGQQGSAAFDAVVVEPDSGQPGAVGVIFLHGFTGNFTMPCWLVAQAVAVLHGPTVCPSVGWRGDWWTANGEATLRASIDYLHRQGVRRIYLAGLSNGAVGASELAYKLTPDIAGLILISGASVDARDSGLPVLVLVGSHDERMPADLMRSYADRIGTRATFVEFQSDHFLLAKDFAEVRDAIDSWLRKQ